MYCRNCGKEIENDIVQCPYCDTPVLPQKMTIEDSGSKWWGVLGCVLPLVGLILYIIWKDYKPNCGKNAALVRLSALFLALFFLLQYMQR